MDKKKLLDALRKCKEENRQLQFDIVLLRLRTEANKPEPKPRHLSDLTLALIALYEEKRNG